VLDWDPALPPIRGTAPHFSAHVCCACQTAGWIKMPLGMEVDLGPGHIVLDGHPAPPTKKSGTATSFRSMSMANGRPSQLLLSSCNVIISLQWFPLTDRHLNISAPFTCPITRAIGSGMCVRRCEYCSIHVVYRQSMHTKHISTMFETNVSKHHCPLYC